VIDHVDIRASDLEASERFYDTVLPVIGKQRLSAEGYAEWGDSSVHPPTADNPVTRRLHVGFYATTRELVDAFHRAGTEAGYRDDGHPNRAPRTGPTPTAAVCSTPTATASKRSTTRRRACRARSTTCGSASRTSRPPGASTRPSRRTPEPGAGQLQPAQVGFQVEQGVVADELVGDVAVDGGFCVIDGPARGRPWSSANVCVEFRRLGYSAKRVPRMSSRQTVRPRARAGLGPTCPGTGILGRLPAPPWPGHSLRAQARL
jgi:catechol 2,3-dioxygenase-like lactoylglutathione lyase family enzyme